MLGDCAEPAFELVLFLFGAEIEERSRLRQRVRPVSCQHMPSAELHDQNTFAGAAFAREQADAAQREAVAHRPFALLWRARGPGTDVSKLQRRVLVAGLV